MHIILKITIIIAIKAIVDDDIFFIKFTLSIVFIAFLVVITHGNIITIIVMNIIFFDDFWI